MAHGVNAVDAEELVQHGQENTLFDGTLEYEDSIYFDPAWDVDFRKFIERTARDQARREKLKEQHPERSYDDSWIEKLIYEDSLNKRTCDVVFI
jgi:hypothetical protein